MGDASKTALRFSPRGKVRVGWLAVQLEGGFTSEEHADPPVCAGKRVAVQVGLIGGRQPAVMFTSPLV